MDGVRRALQSGFIVDGTPPRRVPGLANIDEQMDCVQEVFARAFAPPARASYDGLRPYGTWLARIARNLRIDQHRKTGREIPVADPQSVTPAAQRTDGSTGTGDNSAEHALHRSTLQDATEMFLSGCNEQTQRFVTLRFRDELSQAATAEAMAITRRRVRRLETEVQAELKRYLKNKGLFE